MPSNTNQIPRNDRRTAFCFSVGNGMIIVIVDGEFMKLTPSLRNAATATLLARLAIAFFSLSLAVPQSSSCLLVLEQPTLAASSVQNTATTRRRPIRLRRSFRLAVFGILLSLSLFASHRVSARMSVGYTFRDHREKGSRNHCPASTDILCLTRLGIVVPAIDCCRYAAASFRLPLDQR